MTVPIAVEIQSKTKNCSEVRGGYGHIQAGSTPARYYTKAIYQYSNINNTVCLLTRELEIAEKEVRCGVTSNGSSIDVGTHQVWLSSCRPREINFLAPRREAGTLSPPS